MTAHVNIALALDDLRQLIAKTDALASATADLFDDVVEVEDVDDRRRLERMAHMVGATAEAALAAAEACDQLANDLSTHRPGA